MVRLGLWLLCLPLFPLFGLDSGRLRTCETTCGWLPMGWSFKVRKKDLGSVRKQRDVWSYAWRFLKQTPQSELKNKQQVVTERSKSISVFSQFLQQKKLWVFGVAEQLSDRWTAISTEIACCLTLSARAEKKGWMSPLSPCEVLLRDGLTHGACLGGRISAGFLCKSVWQMFSSDPHYCGSSLLSTRSIRTYRMCHRPTHGARRVQLHLAEGKICRGKGCLVLTHDRHQHEGRIIWIYFDLFKLTLHTHVYVDMCIYI